MPECITHGMGFFSPSAKITVKNFEKITGR